ncbi:MAG: protein kinase [Planctomycetes bacterium]|nr:protein kinase [Planctomycetota bacterium]
MADIKSAEQLAQRAQDVNVLDDAQLQSVWGELGSTNASLRAFQQVLLRRGLLTQYQLERLIRSDTRTGFFYGDYKVLYCVGAGTFARVFRTVHRATGKMYAVKVLRSSLSNPKAINDKTHRSNRPVIDLFRREGEIGSKLKHPNIVEIHEGFSQGVMHYIVMDFVEGRNLREFYRAKRRFDPVEAARIMEGVMAGLNYALQQGITHRDLKMSNVLLSSDGEPKLVDFGLAGLQGAEEEVAEGMSRRTVLYAGLERATGVRIDDPRSDIFFAGTILYQMLTGAPALADTRDRSQQAGRALYRDIKPILELAPKVPLPLAMIVNKALEFDPDRRFQTPADMLVELKLAVKRVTAAKEGRHAEGQELHSQEGLDEQGQPRKLMIVESDVKLQDMLRELFKRNGYRVLVLSDPDRALGRFFDDHRAADAVLFTTSSNGRTALEMFNRFGQESVTRDLPAVLLLDQIHHNWEEQAQVAEHRPVVKMPIKLRQLREVLREALQKKVS